MPRELRALCIVCVVAGAPALAQTLAPDSQSPQLKPRTPDQREQTYEAQRRIHLHVVVTDAAGKPVTGLKPEAFTVLDHDESQKIAQFEDQNQSTIGNDAVHGLVVLDAINGGKGGVERIRKELVKMLGQRQGPLAYPLQMVVVSDAGNRESKPTTDRGALIEDLIELTRNVHSTDCDLAAPGNDLRDSRIGAGFLGQMNSAQMRWDCLNSHLNESLNALNLLAQEQQNTNGRAIVIWTGSGWPLPPKVDTGLIMGGGTRGDLSDAIFALEAGMQEGQVTLEAVSWGEFERAHGVRRAGLQGSLAGATIPEQEAALELPALAQQSGGLVLEKSKSVADALNTCLSDGEQYYAVAFDPAPTTTQGEWHSIEVKVDRPGATVRTLTGYYTQP
ncbi:MAG TPA: VWA domain-containing protein [Terracidiphilus sp.]|nr:VWA domain-containing protein [Terracidiphilus sp.]